MEQHTTIAFQGRILRYRDEDREYPQTLVLLHGFMQNLDVWTPYTLALMRQMRIITIDLPGHGYSAIYGDTHTMEFMAEAVKAVLNDAGVKQCVMVGHSMGGYVTLAFADKYPEMLRGFGLLHSHALADSEVIRERRIDDCQQAVENRAEYVLRFIPNLFDECNRERLVQEIKDLTDLSINTQTESIVAAQRGMSLRPSRIHVLQNANVPVLFVYGKNDSRLPLEIAVSQAMLPQHAEILLLDHVGHMSHIECSEYVKSRIKNFVDVCYL